MRELVEDLITGVLVLVLLIGVPITVWISTRGKKHKDPHTESWKEPW